MTKLKRYFQSGIEWELFEHEQGHLMKADEVLPEWNKAIETIRKLRAELFRTYSVLNDITNNAASVWLSSAEYDIPREARIMRMEDGK